MTDTQKRLLECRDYTYGQIQHLRERRNFLNGHNFNLQAQAVAGIVEELEKVQYKLEKALDDDGITYIYGR